MSAKAATAKSCRLGGLSYVLVGLVAGKSTIKMLAGLVSDEALLLGLHMASLFLCPHMAEGGEEGGGRGSMNELASVFSFWILSHWIRALPL